jgi:hypothetical protein
VTPVEEVIHEIRDFEEIEMKITVPRSLLMVKCELGIYF